MENGGHYLKVKYECYIPCGVKLCNFVGLVPSSAPVVYEGALLVLVMINQAK